MTLLSTKRSHTTSCHPQANSMVEGFHRQLKSALKAQPNPDAWMTTLLLILELLSSVISWFMVPHSVYLICYYFPTRSLQISQHIKVTFLTCQTHSNPTNHENVNIPQSLSTATYVFVRHDTVHFMIDRTP